MTNERTLQREIDSTSGLSSCHPNQWTWEYFDFQHEERRVYECRSHGAALSALHAYRSGALQDADYRECVERALAQKPADDKRDAIPQVYAAAEIHGASARLGDAPYWSEEPETLAAVLSGTFRARSDSGIELDSWPGELEGFVMRGGAAAMAVVKVDQEDVDSEFTR